MTIQSAESYRYYATILRCPSCHQPSLSLEAVWVCSACGVVYPFDAEKGQGALLARSSQTKDKEDIQAFWGDVCKQWYAENDASLTPALLDEQLDHVERFFRKRQQLAVVEMPLNDLTGKIILEIGSGGGAHSALFKRRGANIVSVDITPDRIFSTALKLRLVEEGQGVAFQADAENLPFTDNAFDIVYSNGVLHHSSNTPACIDEVYRLLKPGGLAVLMLYSRHSTQYWLNIVPRAFLNGSVFHLPEAEWIGRVTEGKPKFGKTSNPYTRVYSAKELRALLRRFEDVGLRKNSFRFDYLLIPKVSVIRNAVLRLCGVPWSPAAPILYGFPLVEDCKFELMLGPYLGWCWNIAAVKPV